MNAGSEFHSRCYMKFLSGIILGLGLLSPIVFTNQTLAGPACQLTLEWEPTPDAGVAGYTLYYGAAGMPLTNHVDAGPQNTAVVKGLVASVQYTFYVVAYDANQSEGGPSVSLVYTAPPISSLKLSQSGDTMRLSFRVAPSAACRVEYTDTLSPPNWTLLAMAAGDSNGLVVINDSILASNGMRFYRGVAQ
jgi:hypothetical protein